MTNALTVTLVRKGADLTKKCSDGSSLFFMHKLGDADSSAYLISFCFPSQLISKKMKIVQSVKQAVSFVHLP